jgi:hypothetical protein
MYIYKYALAINKGSTYIFHVSEIQKGDISKMAI